jgi:Domain of Unknown Function (DUF1543)
MSELKLYMLLLGCLPPGRHVEQHDFFFGIATSLDELVAEMKAYWPEPERIHSDAWREVNLVEGFQVNIKQRADDIKLANQSAKLFFINLGGYQQNKFEEQHYVILTVKPDRVSALMQAKETFFFQHNYFEKAASHIDDKYGIDVDDIFQIEDILSAAQKQKYQVELVPSDNLDEDTINPGYLKLSELE